MRIDSGAVTFLRSFAFKVDNVGNEFRVFSCEFVDRSCSWGNEDDPRASHESNTNKIPDSELDLTFGAKRARGVVMVLKLELV